MFERRKEDGGVGVRLTFQCNMCGRRMVAVVLRGKGAWLEAGHAVAGRSCGRWTCEEMEAIMGDEVDCIARRPVWAGIVAKAQKRERIKAAERRQRRLIDDVA